MLFGIDTCIVGGAAFATTKTTSQSDEIQAVTANVKTPDPRPSSSSSGEIAMFFSVLHYFLLCMIKS